MSAEQPTLFPRAEIAPPARRYRFLGRLDFDSPRFPRDAARIIGALDARGDLEAALDEVPRDFRKMVETLVVSALAIRIACAPHLRIRELLLAEVPAELVPLVAPKAKSYQVTKPWLPRE